MIPYGNFNDASTTIHVLQGAAFLFLGVSETVKLQNPATALKKICPAVFFAAGLLSLTAVFYYLGNFSLEETISSLRLRGGLHLLPAFSLVLSALGLSMLMEAFSGEKAFWKTASFFFLFFLLFLNGVFHSKVNPEARLETLAAHLAVIFPAGLALLLKLINEKAEKKALGIAVSVLFLMTGFQLVMYKEKDSSFKYGLVTITEGAPAEDSGKIELPNPAPARGGR